MTKPSSTKTRTPLSDTNRVFKLARRPVGSPSAADLDMTEEPLPPLSDGQALVRTHLLSVDPTTRVWMSDYRGYLPPSPIGEPLRGLGVGRVVDTRRDDLREGDWVVGWTDWQEYCVADDARLISPFTVLPDPLPAPPEAFLGVLGHTGITAYLGIDIGQPQQGETVVVSAASGAVGSVAGQLAKARGARVVGITGGDDKRRYVLDELGFDACVDRTSTDWRQRLAEALPDGVDVNFENAGGEVMDAILMRLNIGARVVLCGMIATYDALGTDHEVGQKAISQLIMQRSTMYGFLVLDHAHRFGEAIDHLAGHLAAGRLRHDEFVVDGLQRAPEALTAVFDGRHRGKVLVRVAD